jgi:hypothetical protein
MSDYYDGLAGEAVRALVPYLGRRKAGRRRVRRTRSARDEGGLDGRRVVLYDTVETLLRDRGAGHTLSDFETDPSDTHRQRQLTLALAAALEAEPAFARHFVLIVLDAEPIREYREAISMPAGMVLGADPGRDLERGAGADPARAVGFRRLLISRLRGRRSPFDQRDRHDHD